MNVTSRDVVVGRQSSHKKEAMRLETQSSTTCFSRAYSHTSTETAACDPGAYVNQITIWTGTNVEGRTPYVTRFDFVCTDGNSYTIGHKAAYHVSYSAIGKNRNSYQAVLVAGDRFIDCVQIGGLIHGDTRQLNSMSACSCAPGLSLVGFGPLEYAPSGPSFASLSIACDVGCPKGTYYSDGKCNHCPPGNEYIVT